MLIACFFLVDVVSEQVVVGSEETVLLGESHGTGGDDEIPPTKRIKTNEC